jgi:murein DD-endopeptidase MepM/ murein hydrolase activator NlpD
MQLRSLLQKLNKTVALRIAAAVVLVTAVVTAVSVFSSLTYVVYANGQAVCSVKSRDVLADAMELLEEKHGEMGISDAAELTVSVSKKLSSLDKANANELCDALYSICEKEYVRAYTVTLGDIVIGSLPTYEEAQTLVDSFYGHIVDKLQQSGNDAEHIKLTTDFVISSVICRETSVSSAEDICRIVLNDDSYFADPDAPSDDRVTADGSLDFLFADKNFIFGMLKNESETVLPEFDFSFNMGELNSAIDYVTYSVEKYSEMIPFKTVFVETDELYVGQTKVVTAGENGIAENVYEIAYENGEEISRKLVSSTVISEAVDRVELVGTKEYPSTVPTGSFIWPIQQKFVITSRFGTNRQGLDASGERHLGIDIAGVPKNTPIFAADGRTVVFTGTSGTYGLLVRIRHESGVETYYAHMNFISVKVGDQVYQGQQIGGVGATGKVTGAHLHFEVRFNGKVVNPEKYLPTSKPQ